MSTPRVGLVARQTLPAALTALAEAATWLADHRCAAIVDDESADAAGLPPNFPRVPRHDLPAHADVIVAFGGDGTMLDLANTIADAGADVPILGVNLGHLGFLTEVSRADLTMVLEALLSGATRTETRLLLSGRIDRHGGASDTRLALNDIVITRGALSRMIEIDVDVDGQFVCHVKADGLILATATGLTAYTLSAGGPIVHPSVDAIVMTPIAPHTLTHRPLVLPASAAITLRPVIDPQSDILVTFDGQRALPLQRDDAVVVSRAPRVLKLMRVTSRTHFDVLRDKLKWGNS